MSSVSSVQGGGMFRVANLGSAIGTVGVIGQLGNAANAAIKGGEAAVANATTVINDTKAFNIFSSEFTGAVKGLAETAGHFGFTAGLVQGGLSLLVNGVRVLNHEESIPVAGGRVAGDTASGFVGGAAAAVAGGFGMAALTMLGLTGGLLTLGGALIGMGAFFVADKLFRGSSLYDKIQGAVQGLLTDATSPTL